MLVGKAADSELTAEIRSVVNERLARFLLLPSRRRRPAADGPPSRKRGGDHLRGRRGAVTSAVGIGPRGRGPPAQMPGP